MDSNSALYKPSTSEVSRPRKIYSLYGSIEDFTFSMPGGWDDYAISVFVDACHKYIDDLVKYKGDFMRQWSRIVDYGLAVTGNMSCFNVTVTMELAKVLKAYLLKNSAISVYMANRSFRELYYDMEDLLEYFPDPSQNSSLQGKKCECSGPSKIKTSPGKAKVGTSKPESVADVIKAVAKQYQHLFGAKGIPSSILWSEMTQKVSEKTGLKVDVKQFLESVKINIAKEVRKEATKEERTKKFLSIAKDYLAIFDYIPPRDIKKKEYLPGQLFGVVSRVSKINAHNVELLPKLNTPCTSSNISGNETFVIEDIGACLEVPFEEFETIVIDSDSSDNESVTNENDSKTVDSEFEEFQVIDAITSVVGRCKESKAVVVERIERDPVAILRNYTDTDHSYEMIMPTMSPQSNDYDDFIDNGSPHSEDNIYTQDTLQNKSQPLKDLYTDNLEIDKQTLDIYLDSSDSEIQNSLKTLIPSLNTSVIDDKTSSVFNNTNVSSDPIYPLQFPNNETISGKQILNSIDEQTFSEDKLSKDLENNSLNISLNNDNLTKNSTLFNNPTDPIYPLQFPNNETISGKQILNSIDEQTFSEDKLSKDLENNSLNISLNNDNLTKNSALFNNFAATADTLFPLEFSNNSSVNGKQILNTVETYRNESIEKELESSPLRACSTLTDNLSVSDSLKGLCNRSLIRSPLSLSSPISKFLMETVEPSDVDEFRFFPSPVKEASDLYRKPFKEPETNNDINHSNVLNSLDKIDSVLQELEECERNDLAQKNLQQTLSEPVTSYIQQLTPNTDSINSCTENNLKDNELDSIKESIQQPSSYIQQLTPNTESISSYTENNLKDNELDSIKESIQQLTPNTESISSYTENNLKDNELNVIEESVQQPVSSFITQETPNTDSINILQENEINLVEKCMEKISPKPLLELTSKLDSVFIKDNLKASCTENNLKLNETNADEKCMQEMITEPVDTSESDVNQNSESGVVEENINQITEPVNSEDIDTSTSSDDDSNDSSTQNQDSDTNVVEENVKQITEPVNSSIDTFTSSDDDDSNDSSTQNQDSDTNVVEENVKKQITEPVKSSIDTLTSSDDDSNDSSTQNQDSDTNDEEIVEKQMTEPVNSEDIETLTSDIDSDNSNTQNDSLDSEKDMDEESIEQISEPVSSKVEESELTSDEDESIETNESKSPQQDNTVESNSDDECDDEYSSDESSINDDEEISSEQPSKLLNTQDEESVNDNNDLSNQENSIESDIDESVNKTPEPPLDDSSNDEVNDEINDEVNDEINDEVNDEINDEVNDEINDEVNDEINSSDDETSVENETDQIPSDNIETPNSDLIEETSDLDSDDDESSSQSSNPDNEFESEILSDENSCSPENVSESDQVLDNEKLSTTNLNEIDENISEKLSPPEQNLPLKSTRLRKRTKSEDNIIYRINYEKIHRGYKLFYDEVEVETTDAGTSTAEDDLELLENTEFYFDEITKEICSTDDVEDNIDFNTNNEEQVLTEDEDIDLEDNSDVPCIYYEDDDINADNNFDITEDEFTVQNSLNRAQVISNYLKKHTSYVLYKRRKFLHISVLDISKKLYKKKFLSQQLLAFKSLVETDKENEIVALCENCHISEESPVEDNEFEENISEEKLNLKRNLEQPSNVKKQKTDVPFPPMKKRKIFSFHEHKDENPEEFLGFDLCCKQESMHRLNFIKNKGINQIDFNKTDNIGYYIEDGKEYLLKNAVVLVEDFVKESVRRLLIDEKRRECRDSSTSIKIDDLNSSMYNPLLWQEDTTCLTSTELFEPLNIPSETEEDNTESEQNNDEIFNEENENEFIKLFNIYSNYINFEESAIGFSLINSCVFNRGKYSDLTVKQIQEFYEKSFWKSKYQLNTTNCERKITNYLPDSAVISHQQNDIVVVDSVDIYESDDEDYTHCPIIETRPNQFYPNVIVEENNKKLENLVLIDRSNLHHSKINNNISKKLLDKKIPKKITKTIKKKINFTDNINNFSKYNNCKKSSIKTLKDLLDNETEYDFSFDTESLRRKRKLPTWYNKFIAEYKKHLEWKEQLRWKMEKEITEIEKNKVQMLEKVNKLFKSRINE